MNTNAIRKHYPALTARERLAVLIAASARGDEAEVNALLDSAPRLTYSAHHATRLVMGFQSLAKTHVAKQLEAALIMALLLMGEDGKDGEAHDLSFRAAVLAAYKFCLRADAWRVFCDGLGVSPADALKNLPGEGGVLELAELIARQFAATRAEAEAYLKQETGEAGQLPTVESLLAHWHEILQIMGGE